MVKSKVATNNSVKQTNNGAAKQVKQAKQAKQKKPRKYLTAVTITYGIITLINENGNIERYRQRGIGRMDAKQRERLISLGLLARDWQRYKELPSNISISYEEPEIMGRARASYPSFEVIMKAFNKN